MKNTFSGIKEEIDGGNYEISPINFIISPANFIISPINSSVDGSISHKPTEGKQLDIGRAELSLTMRQ